MLCVVCKLVLNSDAQLAFVQAFPERVERRRGSAADLLIVPIANAAYFGGKYLERKRAAKEQALNKGVDSVVVVETA